MFQKLNTMRNEDYLDFIRGRPCSFCGKTAIEPHHALKRFRGISDGGLGRKGSDYLTIPVCRQCHERIHTGSLPLERADILELIIVNLVCFLAERLGNKRLSERQEHEAEL